VTAALPGTMQAMVLERIGGPLVPRELRRPTPAAGQVLLEVEACGVCRTDLHLLDGELPDPKLPSVPGHELVVLVVAKCDDVAALAIGQRACVPGLGWTCGECPYCRTGRENLCDRARFTGYQIDGGYAQYTVADAAASRVTHVSTVTGAYRWTSGRR
jgi:propanol-preferring alcohol dehydrogenase